MSSAKSTHAVAEDVFRVVYDSPAALPGRHRWVTADADVRKIEEILGIPDASIGAPLWVSGDEPSCANCGRTTSWLDIVASSLNGVHSQAMVARVILGSQKFVNTETPRAIGGLRCFDCGNELHGIRSFKCHNWAYAMPAIERLLVERSATTSMSRSDDAAPRAGD
jgi:hypothetical protein